jgi:hypothetical protein
MTKYTFGEQVFAILFVIVLAIILAPILWFSYGFSIMMLWNWFVVPLGVVSINIFHALGLSTLALMLTYRYSINKDDRDNDNSKMITVFLIPWTSLLFGYVVHLFM